MRLILTSIENIYHACHKWNLVYHPRNKEFFLSDLVSLPDKYKGRGYELVIFLFSLSFGQNR